MKGMTQDELVSEFTEYAKQDVEGALQLITGLFVGLNVAFVELRGDEGDGQKQITIDGPEGQRKITIHAA